MGMSTEQTREVAAGRYRPEIDGLRAFAVVAVIINHFNKDILPGGYLGVDIFFVISGYVITSSLHGRPSKDFKDFVSGFYERRIKRLVPALSVFVLITSIAICLFNPSPALSLRTGLTSLFGLSNLYLLKHSTDYFAQSTELNIFTHTWSLGVEEQFYFLFPFLIWFSGFGRQTKNGARNLFLVVGALTIASLVGYIYLCQTNQSAAYFLMPTRFWEMAAGCLIFIGFQKRASIELFLGKVPPLLVLGLMVGTMYLPMSLAATSTIAVVALSSILIASLKKKTAAFKLFTNSHVVYLGLISYSLYLWHWGVLSISRWTIGIHWWSVPLQITLMLGLAVASYRWIETPLRMGNWFGKRWKTLVVGGGVLVTISVGLAALTKTLSNKLYLGTQIDRTSVQWMSGNDCLKIMPSRIDCYKVNKNSTKTLWLIGDSHSGRLLPAGKRIADENGMNFILFTAGHTPFPPLNYHPNDSEKEGILLSLESYRQLYAYLLKNLRAGDIIMLSNRLPYYFGGLYFSSPDLSYYSSQGDPITSSKSFQDWSSSIEDLAAVAKSRGSHIVLQTPTPEWKDALGRLCGISSRQWFNTLSRKDCAIPSSFFKGKQRGIYNKIFAQLENTRKGISNVYLFDTYSNVCAGSTCNYTEGGIDIYSDENHLALRYVDTILYLKIRDFLKTIGALQI